jgi:hypothetical protein
MNFKIREWYNEVCQGSVPISYLGQVSKEVIDDLLLQVEAMGEEKQIPKTLLKKMYSISLELLQNIFHHADNPNTKSDSNTGEAAFVILNLGDAYEIIIGNYVREIHIRKIKDRIKQINSLNNEERKTLYKLILNNQEFSQKGGGGLGLIDISRKIEGPLSYEVFKFNLEYFFFQFSIVVS